MLVERGWSLSRLRRTFFQVAAEGVDAGRIAVPRKHESRSATDECVKLPAAVTDALEDFVGSGNKDRVGFNGLDQAKAGDGGDLRGESARTVICMSGVAQPRAALQHSDPGSGKEAHLRSELACLLAAVIEIRRQGAIEEQDRFADGHAVFGAAKAEDVDAALPCHFGRRAAQVGGGIGEARAVHVQRQAMRFALRGNGTQLIERINAAGLSGLGDGDGAGLGIVDVMALGGQLMNGVGRHFAIGAG